MIQHRDTQIKNLKKKYDSDRTRKTIFYPKNFHD